MAVGTIQKSVLTDIANAIRVQNGGTDTYLPSEMAAAVLALDGTRAGTPFQAVAGTGTGVISDTVFDGIADAIRAQNGLAETYTPPEMAPAILALESRLDEPVDIASLARLCCMSETSFREKFKRFTGGVAPLEYRSRLRIERADELLRSGSFTVAEVAAALGFFDTAHFCRTYKKLRGAPPGGALPHSSQ